MKQRQRIRKKAPEGAFSWRALPAGHKGGKGGGGGRTPVEVRDSLHSTAYARVIDLLGEGEIYGPVHGMDNALRDVYLNGTPVANADGTLNFSGAAIDFRTGTSCRSRCPAFRRPSTIAVGAELKAAQHWTRLFANLQASAIRVTLGVEGLSKANTGNGDINGYRVEYAIDLSVDGAGYQEVLASAFDGKTTQRYMRSHRIELPRAPGLEHPPAPHHAQCQQQHHRRPHLHRQRYRGHRRQAALSHVGRGRHQDQRLAVPEYPDARLSRARPHHPRAGQLRSGTAQLQRRLGRHLQAGLDQQPGLGLPRPDQQ